MSEIIKRIREYLYYMINCNCSIRVIHAIMKSSVLLVQCNLS